MAIRYTLFFHKQLGSSLDSQSCLYFQDFKVNGLNTVNAKCILTIFQCQPLSFRDLENLKKFPIKHIKRSETTILLQTFCLKCFKNYPKLTFHFCFLQDDQSLKVA